MSVSPRRAALLMLGAATCFTVMGAIIKHIAPDLPLAVIVFVRMVIALGLMLPLVARGGVALVRTRRPFGLFWRSASGAAALVCYIVAVSHLPLADAVALSFTSPLWSIPIAALFLGERMNRARWIAMVVGFAGVLMIVRPQGALHPAMLAGLVAALLTSIAQTFSRKLAASEPPDRISFYFVVYGTLLSCGPALWWWQTPTPVQFFWLGLIGIASALGIGLASRALAAGEVTMLTPIDFARLPIAALIGLAVFAERPDLWVVLGTAIIAASTIALVRREARGRA